MQVLLIRAKLAEGLGQEAKQIDVHSIDGFQVPGLSSSFSRPLFPQDDTSHIVLVWCGGRTGALPLTGLWACGLCRFQYKPQSRNMETFKGQFERGSCCREWHAGTGSPKWCS